MDRDENELVAKIRGLAPELIEAYMATDYIAHLPSGECTIRIPEDVPLALENLVEQEGANSWAFISACNPYSQELPVEENNSRQDLLKRLLDFNGISYFSADGQSADGSWKEPSLLALGMSLEMAKSMGTAFGQNAILYGELGGVVEVVFCDR